MQRLIKTFIIAEKVETGYDSVNSGRERFVMNDIDAKNNISDIEVDKEILIEDLNGLVVQQFNELLMNIKPPNQIIPPPTAPPGDRVYALVNWAESRNGCGLAKIKESLNNILNPHIKTSTVGSEAILAEVEQALNKTSAHRHSLSEQLAQAYHDKEESISSGLDSSEIDKQILALRRQLREGPILSVGEFLGNGRYRLLERIGQGGFATIWKGYDRQDKQLVAIKILHSQWTEDQSYLTRFKRGAKRMAGLRHPAIVRVVEECSNEEGFYYFVMEYIAGGDLRQAIINKRLKVEEIIAAICQAGEALEYAHNQGLIHRDVKPANILIAGDSSIRLTDFDLVHADDTTGGTRTSAMGTYVFAAPEVMSSGKEATIKSDIYSLAMTLIYGLYGEELPLRVVRNPSLFIDGLECSEEMKAALKKAIADEPEERFNSVKEFCREISRKELSSGSWLKTYNFEVVTLDSKGEIVKLEQGQARYFSEDLGEGGELEMVLIPGGEFEMGSPSTEKDRSDDEGPQHRVRVAEFYMGKYQVTQEQWRVVAGLPKVKRDLGAEPSYFKPAEGEKNLPVERVSWEEAIEFCARLSRKTGKEYRLPSEAEWEYGCRAGTRTPFGFGETITLEYVNYGGGYPYGSAPKGIYREKTVPVGSLGKANRFGIYDMHGNVWEWCLDGWHGSYEGAPEDGSAWDGGETDLRVVRGGSLYAYGGRLCRSAIRNRLRMDRRGNFLGFRLVVSAARTRS
ncbi:MAG: bifunctional serine/threonine-protein kinase/formylglycine-generating enzyme family protein [Acidobacteriota bacterium]